MKKLFIYLIISAILGFVSCSESNSKESTDKQKTKSENLNQLQKITLKGQALGTFYNITYFDLEGRLLDNEIEDLLKDFNSSLSTYDPQSVISKVNKNEEVILDDWFILCFSKAQEISKQTNGAFDMTVAPLVNAWNFGFTKRKNIEEIDIEKINIDSFLVFTGYDNINLLNASIVKHDPRIMLDASAIAKGYAVDIVADYLEEQGIDIYLVEIGGEIRAKGRKPGNVQWAIAIDKPIDQDNEIIHERQAVLSIEDRSLATSGNYRQFYEKDGVKYSHTIDPITGYPVNHNLLSATVLADDCMSADAYATAFMVMGVEKVKEFLKTHPELDAYLVYYENGMNKTYVTENLKKQISQ